MSSCRHCTKELRCTQRQGQIQGQQVLKAILNSKEYSKLTIEEDKNGRTYFILDHYRGRDKLEVRLMPTNYKGKSKNLRLSEMLG